MLTITNKKKELLMMYLICFSLTALVFHFFFEVQPWLSLLHRNVGYRPGTSFMPADSFVFWRFSNVVPLGQIPLNVLGPSLVGKVLNSNPYLIFIFNLSLLLFSTWQFSKTINYRQIYIVFLLIINPVILVQTNYLNKEIYIICATLFFLSHYFSKSKKHLIIFLLLLGATKLEFILIMGLAFFLLNTNKKWGVSLLIFMLIAISIGYDYIPGMASKIGVLEVNSGKSSLSYKLYELNSKFHLFFLVFIPHTAHTIATGLITFFKDPTNIILTFPRAISGVLFLYLVSKTIFASINTKKITKLQLCCLLWFITTATIPFHVHRYILPAYIFLIAANFYKSIENPQHVE